MSASRASRFHAPAQLQPIHVRHHHVDEREIGQHVALQPLERLKPVARDDEGIGRAQEIDENLHVDRFVVDDEDAAARAPYQAHVSSLRRVRRAMRSAPSAPPRNRSGRRRPRRPRRARRRPCRASISGEPFRFDFRVGVAVLEQLRQRVDRRQRGARVPDRGDLGAARSAGASTARGRAATTPCDRLVKRQRQRVDFAREASARLGSDFRAAPWPRSRRRLWRRRACRASRRRPSAYAPWR